MSSINHKMGCLFQPPNPIISIWITGLLYLKKFSLPLSVLRFPLSRFHQDMLVMEKGYQRKM